MHLRVEIEIQLRERRVAHVGHVHVAQPALAHSIHVLAVLLHPAAVEETLLGRQVDGTQHYLPSRTGRVRDREGHSAVDLVSEQLVHVRLRGERCAVDRDEILADGDLAYGRGRERNDLGETEATVALVCCPIEAHAQPACHDLRREAASGDAGV